MTTYFEQIYCPDCAAIHWCETTRNNQKIICHGYAYFPRDGPTHYTRRLGKGIELVEKHQQPQAIPLPLDWPLAIEARQDVEF